MRRFVNIILFVCCATFLQAQDVDEHIMKSSAMLNNGLKADAIELALKGLMIKNDYRLLLILAEAQLQSGLHEQALISYQNANNVETGSGELGMSIIYTEFNMPRESTEHLKKHLQSSFKISESGILLDKRFESIQSSGEWKELWRVKWYTDLERGVSEAEYLVKNNRLEELSDLEKHLYPVYEEEPAMLYLMGIVDRATGNIEEASQNLRRSVEAGYNSSEAWSAFIESLIEGNNAVEAVAASSSALSQYPSESTFLLKRAEANRKIGDRQKALNDIELYLELYPDNEEGLFRAAQILIEKRSYSEALRYISKSIEKYPGNPDHYIQRGDVYSRTATWQYAISDYSMALDIKPRDGDVYYRKGIALLNTGRKDDACRDLRMALKYGNKKASAEINKNCIR